MFNFTVPRWSVEECYKAASHYGRAEWVQNGKRGMKRIRAMTLCCIYYEMEVGVQYPAQTICELLMERDTRSGYNSMNLSRQRVGYFLSLYAKWGILEKESIRKLSHYRRLI